MKYYSVSKNKLTGELVLNKSDYKNRWELGYKRRFIKKLYQLQFVYNDHFGGKYLARVTRNKRTGKITEHYFEPSGVTFLTFTMRTDKKMFIPNQINSLREHFFKIKDILKKRIGNFDYIGNLDFHESGFAHYHFIFFKKLSNEDINHIKEMWSAKYGIGSYEKGIKTDIIPQERLNFVVNYVMRHTEKIFDINFERPGSLLFNSCIRFMYTDENYSGVRFILCSRNISAIMKLQEEEDNYETLVVNSIRRNSHGHNIQNRIYLQDIKRIKEINNYYDYLLTCL